MLIAQGWTHTRAHIPTSRTKARTWFNNTNKLLAQHIIVLSFEWINPLWYRPPSMNNTLTTWRFLIKAAYLGKLSVIYDAENKGLIVIFLVMKIKGCNQ